MLFYKVTAPSGDAAGRERRLIAEHARQLALRCEDFIRLSGGEGYLFLAGISDGEITLGLMSDRPVADCRAADAFLDALGVAVGAPAPQEITFSTMRTMLLSADRCDYIEDSDEVLERFGLDRLNIRHGRGIDFGENLVDDRDKTALYAATRSLMVEETLRTELDRVYAGKASACAWGHPVHYMIETDNRDTRREISRVLLGALYANGRLKSRRYCFLNFYPGQEFSAVSYDALYKSCVGGAVVVRYRANGGDENGAAEAELITTLCEIMLRYRHEVLTVICLPRACDGIRRLFFERLGGAGIVPLREDLVDEQRARDSLRTFCRQRRVRPDKRLYAALEADKTYLPDELRGMFEEWFTRKIKTAVYPQYRDIAACRQETAGQVARGSAYDELRQLVGLRQAKEVIDKALAYYKVQRMYADRGVGQDRPALHMVFTGNPGTAKTTVARLFARIMRENGLLSKGHLVEVGRGDLVGKFVGWTANIVKEKFKTAAGGVLFIDEAYSLIDERGSFGTEAVNTIVQEMENRREDLVVIFAGYPAEMEQFLAQNPGLSSRVAFHVPFADYDTAELCDIARLIGKSKGVSLSDDAMRRLSAIFDAARRQTDFGNGRYVRNVIELSRMNQAGRILQADPQAVTAGMLTRLEEEDIEAPVLPHTPRPRLGFAG